MYTPGTSNHSGVSSNKDFRVVSRLAHAFQTENIVCGSLISGIFIASNAAGATYCSLMARRCDRQVEIVVGLTEI